MKDIRGVELKVGDKGVQAESRKVNCSYKTSVRSTLAIGTIRCFSKKGDIAYVNDSMGRLNGDSVMKIQED